MRGRGERGGRVGESSPPISHITYNTGNVADGSSSSDLLAVDARTSTNICS